MTAIITAPRIPFHVANFDGNLINTEITEQQIKELCDYAARHKYNLEAECRNRYGYGPDWMDREQYSEMMRAIAIHQAARFAEEPRHVHRCVTCGDASLHFDKYCEGRHPAGDVDDECRSCDERMGHLYRRSL